MTTIKRQGLISSPTARASMVAQVGIQTDHARFRFNPQDESLQQSSATLADELFRLKVEALAANYDARARALLGAWVSELEPEIWVGPSGLPYGIGAKGTGRLAFVLPGAPAEW